MTRRDSLIILAICGMCPCIAHSQSDSLADVFPLSVGNQWTYDYRSSLWDQLPDVFYADTGIVTYLITDAIVSQDSTRWIFKERRDLEHTYSSPGIEFPPADTTYALRDSLFFEIVELHRGNHPFYRIWQNLEPEPGGSELSVFPFIPGFADSTTLFRFCEVDSSRTVTVKVHLKIDPHDSVTYRFLFKEAVGELSVQSHGGAVSIVGSSNHSLKNCLLTSIHHASDIALSGYALFQNYPNPFNGSTQIQFQIPQTGNAAVVLFDVLGRKVATLFQQLVQPRLYSVSLSSESIPSGVYFYQLSSGRYRETKKLVVIK